MFLARVSRELVRDNRTSVNFLFVDDRVIRRYNRRYLRHDWVTDVLAFPMKSNGVLGDVMISAETARRQARERGHPFEKELKILSLHGLLNLIRS